MNAKHEPGSGIPADFYRGVLISMRREAITANAAEVQALDSGQHGAWRRWHAHDIIRERKHKRNWWVVCRVDAERGIVGRFQDRTDRSEWIDAIRCNRMQRIGNVEISGEQAEAACKAAVATMARYLGRPLTDDDMAQAYRVIAGYSQRCDMRRPMVDDSA